MKFVEANKMDPNEETNTIVAILRLQPQICKQVEIVVQRLGELLFRFRCHFRRTQRKCVDENF